MKHLKTIKAHKGGFEFRAAADGAELRIYGDIGASFWEDGESVSARQVVGTLDGIQADYLTVRINSHGGSVSDGLAIHNAIRRHPSAVTVEIDGVAMSIASLIAMAGDTVRMANNGLFMVHAPWGLSMGNATELREQADVLDKYAEAMANSYVRNGIAYADVLALLKDGKDHFYTASEAMAFGFVDEESDSMPIAAHFDLSRYRDLPAAAAAFMQRKEGTMPQKPEPAAPTEPTAEKVTAIETAARKKEAERIQARNNTIKERFSAYMNRDGVAALYAEQISSPDTTVEQAVTALLTHIGQGVDSLAGAPGRITGGADSRDKLRTGMAGALLARMGNGKVDASNPWRGLRLAEMARTCLESSGVNVRGMSPEEFAPMALSPFAAGQTTSDFPVVLENTLHKMVLTGFMAQPSTYDRVAKIGDVSDFRAWNRLVPGLIGNLDSVNEAGEYLNKNLPDATKNSVQVTRKGNIINITPEVIVNDDTGYIQNLADGLGRAGPRTIDRAFYTLLESNPTLSDSVALFHASHGNLAGSGAAISATTIDAGAAAMAAQTAPGDDAEPLDIAPGVMLVPRALRSLAIETVNAEYNDDSNKNQRKPNAVRGIVDDIVASTRLTSATAWYLFADPAVAPVIEVVFLNGQREPRVVMEEAFRTGGLSWRVEMPFGVGAIDYRGAWKNAGA